jgi:hypothetical protein
VDQGTVREWLVNMSRRPADKRLAHLLCELLVRLQAVGLATDNSFVLPLTQRQLADTLAMTGVHLNRIVRQLRLERMITLKGHTITIPDVERLKSFADFSPNYLHLTQRPRCSEAEGQVIRLGARPPSDYAPTGPGSRKRRLKSAGVYSWPSASINTFRAPSSANLRAC